MEDGAETPRVAVVSDDMARAVWPGRDPLGQCIRVFVATRPCATVVGVAENIVQDDLTAAQRLHFYLPLDQFAPTGGSTLILRMRGDPAHQSEAVRAALQRAMPGSAYVTVRPLERLVTNARRSWMLGATMFSAFGVLALIVAGVGLYGVVAYDVQRRTHELGVRVALGARSRDVIRLVVGQSAAFAGWGILIGIAIAFLASRWIEPLLFRQSARDVTIYAAVAAMIAAVTVAASILPALRASHADPLVALRMD
jgi:putative ABC transport system permease protein